MDNMTIHIFKTNDYPHYEHLTEIYTEAADAEKRFNELSRELIRQCNRGELQDYQLELE